MLHTSLTLPTHPASMTSGSTTSAAIHEHILNHPSSNSSFIPNLLYPKSYNAMGTKGRSTPRVVCCAIPISKSTGKVLVVQSRKRKDRWVCKSTPLLSQGQGWLVSLSFLCDFQCRKEVGSRRMCSLRLQPLARPLKKVLPVFLLLRRANSWFSFVSVSVFLAFCVLSCNYAQFFQCCRI